jgi:hypothetical protein
MPPDASVLPPPGTLPRASEIPPESPSEGAQLGKNAKSRPLFDSQGNLRGEITDHETGEVHSTKPDPVAVRLERYALQSVARRLLPKSRTAKCLRLRQAHRAEVEVWRSQAHGTAFYGGLQTCASVWCCPPCAAKISERRRAELQAAIAVWQAQGGVVWLLTLTHPHTAGDALAGLLDGEQKALHRFFACKAGMKLKDALGVAGHVRAWEVTHGRLRTKNNGWHPHFHVLLCLRSLPPLPMSDYQAQAFKVWERACALAGLSAPSEAHGASLDGGDDAAAYVAKMGLEAPRENGAETAPTPESSGAQVPRWGLDCEMTKGHTKRAKDGETPFDLLRAVLATKDPEAARLFSEFADAFRGKRQLVWSRGLRELLALGAAPSDAEVECALEADAEILGRLNDDQWRAVLAADLRGELQELARHGWEPVQRLLFSLGVSNV